MTKPASTHQPSSGRATRRSWLKSSSAALAAPYFVRSYAHGAGPNDRIVMGAIGMGGQGRGDLQSLLGFDEVQFVTVCDVVDDHAAKAKYLVDQRYRSKDCQTTSDFYEITRRDDLDAVLIATPDHWHALISIDAMQHGKDVYCEKPECLTIREGQRMRETAARYGRVFSGGSQRVWEDYNWFHRMIRSGAAGEVRQAWVNVGEPSGMCLLPAEETPSGVDWDRWLGPAPWRPFHNSLIQGGFRPFRDYSGGGMTDWGCHTFGGAMFALELHRTGPTNIVPPAGPDRPHLTFRFENGVEIFHGGGDGLLSFVGTGGRLSERIRAEQKLEPPPIHIPNYHGQRGIFGDFVHCVRTREEPFRNIEVAHRTATLCHLGNIAYWLKRPLRWDPIGEQIVGDAEAARWLDRPRREPWNLI